MQEVCRTMLFRQRLKPGVPVPHSEVIKHIAVCRCRRPLAADPVSLSVLTEFPKPECALALHVCLAPDLSIPGAASRSCHNSTLRAPTDVGQCLSRHMGRAEGCARARLLLRRRSRRQQ